MFFHCYSVAVARHYLLLILVTLVVFSSAIVWVYLRHPLPDFIEPRRGFETRGTKWADRITAWSNIARELRHGGRLVRNPSHDPESVFFASHSVSDAKSGPSVEEVSVGFDVGAASEPPWPAPSESGQSVEEVSVGLDVGVVSEPPWPAPVDDQHFCGSLADVYGRAVFAPVDQNSSLFSPVAVLSMCRLQRRLTRSEQYSSTCQRRTGSTECCRVWSLTEYLVLLANVSSCHQLRRVDMTHVQRILGRCQRYYDNGLLSAECGNVGECADVPSECTQHSNAVYNLLHFLLDRGFVESGVLHYSAVFLPLAYSGATLGYFSSLRLPISDGVTRVAGVGLDLGGVLFDQFLLSDTVFVAAAGLVIVALVCVYTGSLLVTMATVSAVALALSGAYFVYTSLLALSFFPFMNVVAAVIVVALGADDTFIVCSAWRRLQHPQRPLQQLVSGTLGSSALSMCVTSVTTAVAFFATAISPVTAISCFAVYSGVAVLLNLVLMLVWVPAFLVLSERISVYLRRRVSWLSCLVSCDCTVLVKRWCSVSRGSCIVHDVLSSVIVRLRFVLIAVLGSVAVAAGFAVLYRPGLQLPDTNTFRLLRPSHPIEVYDSHLAEKFQFESSTRYIPQGDSSAYHLVLSFVWGVAPVDNGSPLVPEDRGRLVIDPDFDLASPASQLWLYNFCADLRRQSFYRSTQGPLLANCIVETLRRWMEGRRCRRSNITLEPASDQGYVESRCCDQAVFPYSAEIFKRCLVAAVRSLYRTPARFLPPTGRAGALFLRGGHSPLAAVIVEFDSSFVYTTSHARTAELLGRVEEWMAGWLEQAPPGMREGWLVTDVELFDLQMTLRSGTVQALSLSLLLSGLLVLLVTRSPLLTTLAGLSVAAVVLVTMATLVLLGWRLNILESVAVTVAIGLSLDFTLHYCVAFRTAAARSTASCTGTPGCAAAGTVAVPGTVTRLSADGCECVREVVGSVLSPVTMAALTSITAGACMLPATVIAYIQIGVFLLVLTATSWCYSTLFFLPLLCVFGGRCVSGEARCWGTGKTRWWWSCRNTVPNLCCHSPHSTAAADPVRRQENNSSELDSKHRKTRGGQRNGESDFQSVSFRDPPPSPILRLAMR